MDWNDLRYFIAVAETGSTLSGGKKLHVSQTTAARRIAALEDALDLILFDRSRTGYTLTPVGEALLESARAVGSAADEFAKAADSQVRDISGSVKLTTLDIYAETLLPPMLKRMRTDYPGIRIEIETTQEPRDLASGDADIALRNSNSPTGGGLVGRRIADDGWTIYCSRSYARENGIPKSEADLVNHAFIGGGGENFWRTYRQWLRDNGLEDQVAVHHATATGILSAVRAGGGLAVMPSFFADHDPELVQCLPPRGEDENGLWLLTHERLRHVPRIRAVLDYLAKELKTLALQPPQ